jgi:uroporphyrinogen-III decarboxylase
VELAIQKEGCLYFEQIHWPWLERNPAEQDFSDIEDAFWGGGCDTRHVLPCGTPDEVRTNVRELVSSWAPGGGFVFQQVHNILADVPPENIIAMFEAARLDYS